jgi:hypothetical protein
MAATPLSVIQQEISERKTALEQALIKGGAKDYADYRAMCGEIRGLNHAHVYVNDLVQRIERGEDD